MMSIEVRSRRAALAEADTIAAPVLTERADELARRLREAVEAPISRPEINAEAIGVGSTIDHFTIERELGRGGMGVVYLAHDNSLDRHVALKVIVPKKKSEADRTRERFFREARAQAKLASPFVVHIHYIGAAGAATYFAMEHVQGESLEALLERGEKLDPERARVLMLEVAHGLSAAHSAGFIHRDIKPSNLLVDGRTGRVKIADFGLAKPLPDGPLSSGGGAGAAAVLTEDGVVLGTPMYMPPEQITGVAVDHRSDIYALGATFWNLIAGRPPYDGDSTVMIFAKHMNDPVPSLRSAVPNIPVKLAAIIEKMMSKDKAARYATYEDLIAALESAAPTVVEPAGFSLRAAASAIDLTIAFFLLTFTGLIGGALYLAGLIVMQAYLGQTIGKYLLRIKVERIDGSDQKLGFARSALRLAGAGWLPLYYGTVLLLTQGKQGLFESIRASSQTDDLRGFLTAFVLQHVVFSLLYAGSLGLAAVHREKRAVHDLVVRTRVVHVRQVVVYDRNR
jgi:tRNA A-37 threonylcarbamoyl transferase component Bud32/uncharacterized RDD family membrane protein YckC